MNEIPVKPDPVIEARAIGLDFNGVSALKDVSVSLLPGRVHALVGENGAGKSSLAKVISGVYRPTRGEIRLLGGAVQFGTPLKARLAGVALIHQEPTPFPDLTLAENIFVGSIPKRLGIVDRQEMLGRAEAALNEIGLSRSPTDLASRLPIAEQQLLELAAAIVQDARVVIFDETTAPLTPNEVERLFAIIERLKQRGVAIGIVSHHLHEVFRVADEVSVLRDGSLVAGGSIEDFTRDSLIQAMVGRDIGPAQKQASVKQGPEVLKVVDLSGPGFSSCSLTLHEGEILGIGGLVGAGRTEILKAIAGLSKTHSGSLVLNGKPETIQSAAVAAQKGIAMVPEDRRHDALLLERPIRENVVLPLLRKLSTWLGFISRRAETEVAESGTGRFATKMSGLEQSVGELSGGNQQKVVLASRIAMGPRILLLDEPTRGVDIGAKQEIHEHIRALAQEGVSILLVSSDLPELLALSHRVVVMAGGHMTGELSGDQITEERVMSLAVAR